MATPAHNSTTEAVPPGEHGGGFPPFQSHTFASQLVWLAIFFVLLYVLMAKWALPQVGAVIENRRKRIDADVAEAGRLKQESDAAVAAYEKALADARARAQAIASETREKQAAEADASRKRLEDALNVKLADAEKTIAATKEAAMANVRGIAEEAATAIVERLIGAAPSGEAVAEAVAGVLKR
jgi:F-type H+-transporting ATPase subunit b